MFTTTPAEALVAVGLVASAVFGLSDPASPNASDESSDGHAASCSDTTHGEPHRDMHRQMMRAPQMRDMHGDHMGSTAGMSHMHRPSDPSN